MKRTLIALIACMLLLPAAVVTVAGQTPIPLGEVPNAVKAAKGGDKIVIKNGTYHDVRIVLHGAGSEGNPIVIVAETPGGVTIEGESYLRLSGSWMTVSGLHFRNGYSPTGTIIEYRNGSRHAFDCRVTECVIEGFNPPRRNIKGNWVQMYGRNNRFDHNTVVGKLNEGVTLAAVLDNVDGQCHRIDHNFFGPRPVYGSNGAETIRTGNSFTSRTSSHIVIEDNYFLRCSGEVEILSIKSSDNIIRRNTFIECEGGIALRHGDRNTIESNVMIGNGKPNTGGIRVINKGHRIYNNYMEGLAGEGSFAPFAIMNGVPDSPDYRYHRVEEVEITRNTFVDCTPLLFGWGKDFERTETAREVRFSENMIMAREGTGALEFCDDASGIAFSGNKINSAPGREFPEGFSGLKAGSKGRNSTIYYDNGGKGRAPEGAPRDATGNPAKTASYAGAVDPANAGKPLAAATRAASGAAWFEYNETDPRQLSGNTIAVAAGQNTLLESVALSVPGDILELVGAGEYWNDRTVAIPHYLVIRAEENTAEKPCLRYNGRGNEPMITITDGGHLDLRGIRFNGIPEVQLRDPKGFINTDAEMLRDYTLFVEDCEFSSFNRSGTYAITCMQGSFARWIKITGCRFTNLPWDAIVLTRELDFYGRYNTERLTVENCLFANVGGRCIDLSRLGYDESTAGPSAVIDHCTFVNSFNREQGSVVDLTGVQNATVSNCLFEESGKGGAAIRFNEMRKDKVAVSNCNLFRSGRIYKFHEGGIRNIYGLEPVYTDRSAGDYRQAPGSPLAAMGSDGKAIGIN